MSTPTAVASSTPKLVPGRIKDAEFARRVHRVTPEASTQLQDVLNPTYWSHVAAKFTVNDLIEVVPEGSPWFAQLLIIGCSKQHAKVAVVSMTQLRHDQDQKEAKEPPKFVVEWKGPARKFAVIRNSDKEYIQDGFDDKESAAKWLTENEADLTE